MKGTFKGRLGNKAEDVTLTMHRLNLNYAQFPEDENIWCRG